LNQNKGWRAWCAFAFAVTGLVIGSSNGAGQKSQKDSGNQDTVTVVGCPVHGVEAGCMVVTGKDGAVWEIGSAQPRPKVGYQQIRLSGKKSRGVSTCMQGTRLEGIQWSYTGEKCPETPGASPGAR
jgi:hypothetical protein